MNKKINVVYAEEKALAYPLARQVLDQLPDANLITIRHYKDIFNRPGQNQHWQKNHQALILAVKPEPYLYAGPPVCQNFGCENFYYANFLLGCPFDCSYCYLQGMHPSAHLAAFVNVEDILAAIGRLDTSRPTYLALSHDADLFALNKLLPYLDILAARLDHLPQLLAEIRTKWASEDYFQQNLPHEKLIFAFSLAPQPIIDRYEKYTPNLASRLAAIKTAQARGYRVRLCFDPVFCLTEDSDPYPAFFREVFSQLDPVKIFDAS